jgi:phosphoribosylaminoimidazole carboxylase (NCAIR synthetase)
MVNLLGEAGYSGEALYQGFEEVLSVKGVHVHLYGKKLTKPFRKMGHVTILDKIVANVLEAELIGRLLVEFGEVGDGIGVDLLRVR